MEPINIDKQKLSKEIAGDLDCGFRVFLHRTTLEIVTFPDEDLMMDDMDGLWKKDISRVKKHKKEFFEFEKWHSSFSFDVMAEFAENLKNDNFLQQRLIRALENRKPFREFKFLIDNSGEYRDMWFKFRDKMQEDYVMRQLDFEFREDEGDEEE